MNWFLISASVCMWSLPHLYLCLCFYLYFLTSLFSWFLAQKPNTKFASLTWLLSLNVQPNSLASQKSNSNPREQEPDWLDSRRDHSRSSCLWPGVKVTCLLSRACGNSPCKVYGHVLKGREELGKKWLTEEIIRISDTKSITWLNRAVLLASQAQAQQTWELME